MDDSALNEMYGYVCKKTNSNVKIINGFIFQINNKIEERAAWIIMLVGGSSHATALIILHLLNLLVQSNLLFLSFESLKLEIESEFGSDFEKCF